MLQIYFAPRSGPVWSAMWSDNTRSEPALTSAATSNHIWLCGSVLHRTTFRSVVCSAVEWVGSSKSCNKYRKQLWGGCFEKHRIIWVDLLQYASLAHNAISVHSPIFIGAQLPHSAKLAWVQNWKQSFGKRIAHTLAIAWPSNCDTGTKKGRGVVQHADSGGHFSNVHFLSPVFSGQVVHTQPSESGGHFSNKLLQPPMDRPQAL